MEQLGLFENQDINISFKLICEMLDVDINMPAWPDNFGRNIMNYLKINNIPNIRTLSLFSGAGGLDIGFTDIGFEIVESVEIEEKFCDTLRLNTKQGEYFESSKINCIDIKLYSSKQLDKIDFIIGGPPCQTFSAAGRRANGVLGITDSRGILFIEYIRLLKELSPVGFLFENVYGITGAQGGKAWEEIRNGFLNVGYKLFYRIIDAADYGVPQHRERLIIVGVKSGNFRFPKPTHGPDSPENQPFYNAGKAIESINVEEDIKLGIGGKFGHLLNGIPPGLNYSFYTEEMGHPQPIFAWRSKFSDFLYKADPNSPVRTIKASGGAYTGPFHWDNRKFTFAEYKRLQTFPDRYKISGPNSLAIKQIGNSVPPQLARIMALSIRQQIFNTRFPFTLPLLNDNEELTFRKRKRLLTSKYRKIAKYAIGLITEESDKKSPHSHVYFCILKNNFEYVVTDKTNSTFFIKVLWNDSLCIEIYDTNSYNINKNSNIPPTINISSRIPPTINISSRYGDWNLGVKSVCIYLYSKSEFAFTVGWKSFEYELLINNIKADIIQLNGYYQYIPRLLCSYNYVDQSKYNIILCKIVSGIGVRIILSTSKLAELWDIPTQEIINVAEYLRRIGYEIRNHNTNPQIDKDKWLIPYAFPTLTHLSVQLNKRII